MPKEQHRVIPGHALAPSKEEHLGTKRRANGLGNNRIHTPQEPDMAPLAPKPRGCREILCASAQFFFPLNCSFLAAPF